MCLKVIWVLVIINISHCIKPPHNCSVDFNDKKDALVVMWVMDEPKHNVTKFEIKLVTYLNNGVFEKKKQIQEVEKIKYEHRISTKYQPAATYRVLVASCKNDGLNCNLAPDPCIKIVPPDKPEVSANKHSCQNEVCTYYALITNHVKNSSLYILNQEKTEELNLDNPQEAVIFLNKSSILMVNVTNNTQFDIDISQYCSGEIYLIAVNTYENYYNFSDVKHYSLPGCKTAYTALILVLILLIIISILAALLVYFIRRNREGREDLMEVTPLTRMNSVTKRYSLKFFKRLNGLTRELDLDGLDEFLKTKQNLKDILMEEYKEFPLKLSNLYGAQYGGKNRYTNILPYEGNRVKIYSNPCYDYINASYIKGFSGNQKYIATQGPLRSSLDDFWGMIWDHNVEKIVMLTNFMEHGQIKCDGYWLEGSTKHLTKLTIVHQASKTYIDYIIREFKIVKGNNNKVVTHYHFTNWADDTIPQEINSLINFIRIIRESQSTENKPIVVHCSGGVGRTGVFILCDYLLDMYKTKRILDIPNTLYYMRNFRMNMIKNELQYIFTYCLMNEYLKEKTSEMKLETLIETMQIFTQDINLAKDIETTAEKDYLLDVMYTKSVHFGWENNKHKHRTDQPPKNCSGFISLQRYPLQEEESYYTSAVKIPNQTKTKTYISTIQPLPNTVRDFWRLVDETKASIILSLHDFFDDPSSVVFWPTSIDEDYSPCNYLRLSFKKVKKCNGFVIVELRMYNTSKDTEDSFKERTVHVLHFHEWTRNSLPNTDEFIKYFKRYVQLSKISGENNTTLIACSDGIKGCGLFLTFLYVIEKISHEGIFDLCGRITTLRYYLDGIMTMPIEYKYIYECVQLLYESENNNLINYYL